ncbi:hypothetical protein SMITH_204 [Smithella sp. ME-1]|nr:hypothetical protein SMITH_204 [Smithella sp. ME-1]
MGRSSSAMPHNTANITNCKKYAHKEDAPLPGCNRGVNPKRLAA